MDEGAEDDVLLDPHRADGHFDWKLMPIPMQRLHFDATIQHRPLARLQVMHQSFQVLLAHPRRDDGFPQRTPDCLLPAPAENSLRLRVPIHDDPFPVHCHIGVIRILNDQPHPPLADLERMLCRVALSDVMRHSDHPSHRSIFRTDG